MFPENQTKNIWYSLVSVLSSGGMGLILVYLRQGDAIECHALRLHTHSSLCPSEREI